MPDVKYILLRGDTSGIASTPLADGQILFDKTKGKIAIDAMVNNVLTRIDMSGEDVFCGTTAEWTALTDAEKSAYTYVYLTDDFEDTSVIDDELSPTSTNAVQNKVIYTALGSSTIVIKDSEGTTMPHRSNLKFVNATVTDDETNDTTIVTAEGGGGGVTLVQIPSVVVGTYTYNGTAQGPTITGLDTTHCTVTNASQTNAGNYTMTIALKDANTMMWTDLTTESKTYTYFIDKALGVVNVSKTSMTLDKDNPTDSFVISNATGDITITSSDSEKAYVNPANLTAPGGTVLVTGEKSGEVTITVSVAETTNYLSTTETITVTCEFSSIFGAEWDGTATTAWTRTDASQSFVDPVPYVAGAASYSSPFDDYMPWAGMVKEERTGGTMVKIPKFWYKLTQNGTGMKIQIADSAEEGFSVSPAHMDRGDGQGERDVVYVGRYHCGSSAYKSVTGQTPKNNITRSTARSAIAALDSDLWQMDFATRFTIWLLYIVEFADWNSQTKIGYGCGNNSSVEAMGYTDSMPYHTGTTQSSRTTYGLGTQYRNIEGLWDNVYDWCDGCYYDSNGLNIILNPNNFSDSSGGTAVGVPTSGYPSAFTVENVSGTFPTFIPTTSSGSGSTYSCDYWNFDASNPCLYVGGVYYQSLYRGLFYVDWYSASNSSAFLGCRLLELP